MWGSCGGKWSTPKYAINGIKEGVSKLKALADTQAKDIENLTTEKDNAEERASNAENAKTDLENAIAGLNKRVKEQAN